MGRDSCRGVSVKWIICGLSVFRKTFTKRAFFFSPMYCLLHFLHSVIYVKLVELQVIWCLICLVSPVLVKVYDVLPFSMNGQVRPPCFETQRNVPDRKGFRFAKCNRKRVPQLCSTIAKTFLRVFSSR